MSNRIDYTNKTRASVTGGSFESWHMNGELWQRGVYENGKRVGEWRFWYPSGQLDSVFLYEQGEVKSERHWLPNGRPFGDE